MIVIIGIKVFVFIISLNLYEKSQKIYTIKETPQNAKYSKKDSSIEDLLFILYIMVVIKKFILIVTNNDNKPFLPFVTVVFAPI